jgi:hypothetical protein
LISNTPAESAHRAVGSAWTRPLQLWFVSLQVTGIYGVAAAVFAMSIGVWIFVALVADILHGSAPGFTDAAGVVLGDIFGQPAAEIAGLVVMIVASIFITRGAFRHEGWAHGGAIALVAISTVPVIQIAVFFRELAVWLIAFAYFAACVAFVVAMTYAFVKHGPWGVPAQATSR